MLRLKKLSARKLSGLTVRTAQARRSNFFSFAFMNLHIKKAVTQSAGAIPAIKIERTMTTPAAVRTGGEAPTKSVSDIGCTPCGRYLTAKTAKSAHMKMKSVAARKRYAQ